MIVRVLSRLGAAAAVLGLVVTASFVLLRTVPGGPFDSDREFDPVIAENLRRAYDLDAPLGEQFVRYLGGLLRGDLGPSLRYRDHTVTDILAQSLPVSVRLGMAGLAVALGLGLPAGAAAARRRGSALDTLVMAAASIGLAVPNFMVAAALVLLFVFHLGWLPVAGTGTPAHLVLPALALGLPHAALVARLFRTGLLEVLGEDWITVARAKGLSPSAVVWRHAARPALLPVVSALGPAVAGLLSGSLVVEQVFALSGVGRHFVDSALNADYNLALGIVIVYTALLSLANLAVDLAHEALDPRIGSSR